MTGLGPLRTRLQRSARRGLTKFVGREREMDAMQHAAGTGQDGPRADRRGDGRGRGGQVAPVLSSSRRSRRADAWCWKPSRSRTARLRPTCRSSTCSRATSRSTADDDERKRREKIAGKVLMLDRALEDTLPYLFALLGVDEDDDPLAQLDPQIRQRRTLEAIKRILLRESLNQPLIVDVRGPPLDRQRDPGAARTCWSTHRHRPHPAAGELSPRVPPSMGQQDLLHATAARPAGQGERRGDADRAAGRRRRSSHRSSGSSSNRPRAIRSSWKRWCRRSSSRARWCATAR